ncbi:MAG: methionine--tRNA ligase subunit beta [Candidatus Aenigmatarchaeota archaeon]
MEKISFNDFQKLDLRVGKIIKVEKIKNTDKLYKIEIDLGSEKRTIVSGIADKYTPDELMGQLIVVVVNLEEKIIKGVKSEGMLLAVDDESGPVLIVPLSQVKVGSKVR